MAALIGYDIHPLINLRVLDAIRNELGTDGTAARSWTARWIDDGFAALEPTIAAHGEGFAWGDAPMLADCYLVPDLYSLERFGVDLSPSPRLVAAVDHARVHPDFKAAHPDCQPGAQA